MANHSTLFENPPSPYRNHLVNRNPSCCHRDSAIGEHIDHIRHLAIGRQHDTKNRHPNKLNREYQPKDTWNPRYELLEHLRPNMPKIRSYILYHSGDVTDNTSPGLNESICRSVTV